MFSDVSVTSIAFSPKIDISYFYRSALDKELLLQDHKKIVDQINKYEIDYANLYHLFGNSLEDRNLADTNNLKDNVTDLTKVTDFCVDANITGYGEALFDYLFGAEFRIPQ